MITNLMKSKKVALGFGPAIVRCHILNNHEIKHLLNQGYFVTYPLRTCFDSYRKSSLVEVTRRVKCSVCFRSGKRRICIDCNKTLSI